jgi:hypothetical protein
VDAVDRYLLLGLRLGRHVDGLVDAYFGPPELAAQVEAEEPTEPAALVAEGEELLAEIPPETWLHDQVRGLRTYAGVLAGEGLSYSDEVEGCYGVRPERTSEDVLAVAHERLQELLPGDGPLEERYEQWRVPQFVAPEQIAAAAQAIVSGLRARTERLFGVPAGEAVELEPVTDEPWLAFNYYLGELRSRIAVNVELPITGPELVELLAHETYPGHHTEHAWKEQLLVRDGVLAEEAILLVPTPQAVVSEGIAESCLDFIDPEAEEALEEGLARLGIATDLGRARQVLRAREPLRGVGLNAALLIHEEGVALEEVEEYVRRWRAVGPAYAKSTVRFVTDPTWRAYVITYSVGRDLCRAYHGGDPARFRRLLTEQVRVQDLLDAAAVRSGA